MNWPYWLRNALPHLKIIDEQLNSLEGLHALSYMDQEL